MRWLFSICLILAVALASSGRVQSLSAADRYHGQVVDEETGQPLVGAAVTVIWYKTPVVQMEGSRFFQNAQETTTDAQGKFTLLVSPGTDWNPFTSIIKEPTIIMFQPGYEPVQATWLIRMGFKSYMEFASALQKGYVVKLSKLKTEKELRYYASGLVHPLVPRDRIPLLANAVNIHRKKIGIID